MNPVEKIRENQKANLLHDLAAKPHRKRIIHLDLIKSIGVIAKCLSDDEQITLSQFTHHMSQRGIQVHKIELPVNAEELLGKYGFPKPDFIQQFTSYHYDLLIDTTPSSDTFGLYITLNTSSSLRVAYENIEQPRTGLELESYDFIIRGHGECELSSYLTNILNYMINIKKQ